MKKKILIVVTNISKFPKAEKATGLFLGEAVQFIQKVAEAGFSYDFVSPKGGYTPMDPNSLMMDTHLDWEYYQNNDFMSRLGATLKPSQINPDDYGCIYYTGGHGVVWDFPDNTELQAIAAKIYANGGIVSSVCHGVVGLLNIKLPDGTRLIQGKKLTGFSNMEEVLALKTHLVPFLAQTELVKHGAIYEKAHLPYVAYAVEDGRLITGQNPLSAGPVADLVIPHLKQMS